MSRTKQQMTGQKHTPIKKLWRIVLNYSREVSVYYNFAYTERQALEKVFRRIAKAQDVPLSYVRSTFNGQHDNITIEIDKEWAEKHN